MLFIGRLTRYFRDAARNIFWYHDGTKWVRADPLVVGTALEAACPDFQDLLDVIRKEVAVPLGGVAADLKRQKREAADKLDAAARAVFGLPSLSPDASGAGVTTGEAIAVLTRYFMFMHRLAEDAQLFRDSPATA